jgi:hypothetical protein
MDKSISHTLSANQQRHFKTSMKRDKGVVLNLKNKKGGTRGKRTKNEETKARKAINCALSLSLKAYANMHIHKHVLEGR